MTESTQLQATDNNNAGVTKMEPPPPLASTSPAPSAALDQLQQQQQQQQQQQYALKWNDFQASILSSFRHLRDEEDFVDVTLACDQRSFTAHKVVLSACSPYFRRLLKANPCEHPIVILRDVRSDDVENLLSFMYNGEVNVSHEQLPDFLKTAHLLQIRGLADVNGSGFGALNKQHHNNNNTNIINNNNNNNTTDSSNKLHFPSSVTGNTNNNNNNINNNSSNLSINSLINRNSNTNNSNSNSNNNSNNNSSNDINNTAISTSNNNNNNCSVTSFTSPASLMSSTIAAAAANLTAVANSNSSHGSSAASSGHTPAIQELKASAASPVRKTNNNKANHWDLAEADSNRLSHLTPPPQKRIKSADLFRAQHGISPERLLLEREFPVAGQHPLTRERHRDRDRSRETSRDRERNMELRESLLGQALENSNGQQMSGMQKSHGDLASLHAQSAGEDSNSSDTEPSDRGDGQHDDSMNGSLDNQRSHSFPSAFLGLQGIPGLLPGPSGMAANDFVTRRSLEMRVRATDPRPCPKCGKIYRSAHTLRTHLEDKHTVCPGYRCVLCGTVAKSRNSLHSHMSRQHRGISTKDLPVLPMPSAFDPEMASRLLAKAGVKISPAELRARASPTSGAATGIGSSNSAALGNSGGSVQAKMDMNSAGGGGGGGVGGGGASGMQDDVEDSDDDPEDLTTGSGLYCGNSSLTGSDLSRYHESILSNFGQHASTTISRFRSEAAAAAAVALSQQQQHQQKELGIGSQMPSSNAGGQSLLDTYLQFITENTFGMNMSQEHAAAAALHAAKMAQLNAMGHGLDKLPTGLLQPQFDLSKLGGASAGGYLSASANGAGVVSSGLTIEPVIRRAADISSGRPHSPNCNGPIVATSPNLACSLAAIPTTTSGKTLNIRRGVIDSSEPMDLGLDNQTAAIASGEAGNPGAVEHDEDNYSEDEGAHQA